MSAREGSDVLKRSKFHSYVFLGRSAAIRRRLFCHGLRSSKAGPSIGRPGPGGRDTRRRSRRDGRRKEEGRGDRDHRSVGRSLGRTLAPRSLALSHDWASTRRRTECSAGGGGSRRRRNCPLSSTRKIQQNYVISAISGNNPSALLSFPAVAGRRPERNR